MAHLSGQHIQLAGSHLFGNAYWSRAARTGGEGGRGGGGDHLASSPKPAHPGVTAGAASVSWWCPPPEPFAFNAPSNVPEPADPL